MPKKFLETHIGVEVVDGEAYLWSGGDWRGATDTRDSPAPPAGHLRLSADPVARSDRTRACGGPGPCRLIPGAGWGFAEPGARGWQAACLFQSPK